MASEPVVPTPRDARRIPWNWGESTVCVVDDGSSVDADGTVHQMAFREIGSAHPPGRGRWLQLDGNRFVIFTETDEDRPAGIWFTPLSILREKIAAAVAGERAMIDGGEARAMKTVLVTSVGGRKFGRRAWTWRTRNGTDATTEWIDDAPLDWENYRQADWPKKPANREAVAA